MNQPLTDQQLGQIEARAHATDPGPWTLYDDLEGDGYPGHLWVVRTPASGPDEPDEHSAVVSIGDRALGEFIAHAREDVPALLAEVHRLRDETLEDKAEIAKLRDLLGKENKRANAAIDREETAEQAALEAQQERDAVRDALAREERLHGETIDDRDQTQEIADKLAYAVAPEEVIGEHSSMNCPWTNALDLITPAAEVRRLRINPPMVCINCETPVGWIDCPTGGWWAHETHPADGHDAYPKPAPAASAVSSAAEDGGQP